MKRGGTRRQRLKQRVNNGFYDIGNEKQLSWFTFGKVAIICFNVLLVLIVLASIGSFSRTSLVMNDLEYVGRSRKNEKNDPAPPNEIIDNINEAGKTAMLKSGAQPIDEQQTKSDKVIKNNQDGLNLGTEQHLEGNEEEKEKTQEVIDLSVDYYLNVVYFNPENDDIRDRCINKHGLCSFWAAYGQCDVKFKYMQINCPLACQTCEELREDYHVIQKVEGNDAEVQKTQEVIQLSKDYFSNDIMDNPEYADIRHKCVNKHDLCSFWAAFEQCEVQYEYMQLNCPLACRSCEKLIQGSDNKGLSSEATKEKKYELTPSCKMEEMTQAPVMLNELFEVLKKKKNMGTRYSAYVPIMHSCPSLDPKEQGRWLVTVESFLTDSECDYLMGVGSKGGSDIGAYTANIGIMDFRGPHQHQDKNCEHDDPMGQLVTNRIAEITGGIPDLRNETQLLLFQHNEEHNNLTAHDCALDHNVSLSNSHFLFFSLYLEDLPDGSNYKVPFLTSMDFEITPRKGTIVLWSSHNEDISEIELLPQKRGTIIDTKLLAQQYLNHHNDSRTNSSCEL